MAVKLSPTDRRAAKRLRQIIANLEMWQTMYDRTKTLVGLDNSRRTLAYSLEQIERNGIPSLKNDGFGLTTKGDHSREEMETGEASRTCGR